MKESIIEVKHLEKIYPNGFHALKDIQLKVQQGEFLVIIGLSGSGKSTLLRCLNRLHDPTSGEIIFRGKDVAHVQGPGIEHNEKLIWFIQ